MGICWPGPALIFRWRQWYQLGKIWNELPNDVKNATDLNLFKKVSGQKVYKSKGPQVKRATSQKVPSQKVPSQEVSRVFFIVKLRHKNQVELS